MSAALTLTLALAAIGIGACQSPLDVATPRIDTPLRMGLAMKEVSVSAQIMRPLDTTTIGNWPYRFDHTLLSADTAVHPRRVWLDCTMRSDSATTATCLSAVRFVFDSVAADGTLDLAKISAQLTATVLVNGKEFTSTDADTRSAVMQFIDGPAPELRATIVIGMNRGAAFSALVVVNVRAGTN